MTTYKTGNPIGSTSPKDLYDNAENLDNFLNGAAPEYQDRLGVKRRSLSGIEQDFRDFLANSGYEVIGDYGDGALNLTRPSQVFSHDGQYWRASASLDLPYVTLENWIQDQSNFVSVGEGVLRQDLAADDGASRVMLKQPGGVRRSLQDRILDRASLADFGADHTGAQLCDDAGAAAEVICKIIYVPEGIWRFSSPFVHGVNTAFYGPGILKYDKAEWFRAGGSAGAALTERFTLFFIYASQSDVYCEVDGVAQPITWLSQTTFAVPAPPSGTKVKYGAVNGLVYLGSEPERIRSYNMFANGANASSPVMDDDTYATKGFNNSSYGSRAMHNVTTASNSTAVGARALETVTTNGNNTAIGFQTLYRTTGSGNTGVGSACMEWLESGEYNAAVGQNAGSKLRTGGYNAVLGYQALGESSAASYAVAVGHRALGNSGEAYDVSNNTAVGAFAGDFCRGQQNSFVGYRAGTGPNSGSDGEANVAIGFFAMRNQAGADYNVAIGVGSAVALTSGQNNVLLGYEAGSLQTTGNNTVSIGYRAGSSNNTSGNVAVGYQALLLTTTGASNVAVGDSALDANVVGAMNVAVGTSALGASTGNENTAIGYNAFNALTSGIYNVAIGSRSARLTTVGSSNTAVGRDALYNNTTGGNNTAVGFEALKVDQSGAVQAAFSNVTGLGSGASVSGSNQVQIGNSSTTTYVYGTVQNRSDVRDKTDIRESALGLDFVMGLRAVEGRWDLREDYFEELEVVDDSGVVQIERRPIPKDGSKSRERFHQWFLAQEVKELCDKLGVDFGGYQDHAVHGGCDVLSLGYDEFIPPVIKAMQELKQAVDRRLSKIEARLDSLEG